MKLGKDFILSTQNRQEENKNKVIIEPVGWSSSQPWSQRLNSRLLKTHDGRAFVPLGKNFSIIFSVWRSLTSSSLNCSKLQ